MPATSPGRPCRRMGFPSSIVSRKCFIEKAIILVSKGPHALGKGEEVSNVMIVDSRKKGSCGFGVCFGGVQVSG